MASVFNEPAIERAISTVERMLDAARNSNQAGEDAICAAAAGSDLLGALKLLVADAADYPAWARPCHAIDVAEAAIAKAEGRS